MKALLVLVAALAFAIAPFLSPEFGGFDPNRYPIPQDDPPVQPAGWAFSIWGIIYIGLVAHAFYGFFKQRQDEEWDKGRLMLALSLGVGAFWLPVALISPIWATVMIWIMLASALAALLQIRKAQPTLVAQLPVALYGGWLSAASFVSIGLLLGGYGFFSEIIAAIIALGLATIFVIYFQTRLQNWAYGIAAAWGFFAIAIANLGISTLVTALAGIATAFVLFTIAMQLKKSKTI